jgi:hypothetical protein
MFDQPLSQRIKARSGPGGIFLTGFNLTLTFPWRLRPEACITTGLIVLLDKELIFVYVVFYAVKLYDRFTILYGVRLRRT